MRFFSDLYIGIRSYWKALIFIRDHRFYWYFLIPLILMPAVYKLGELIIIRDVHPKVENMNEIIWFMLYMLAEISVALLLMKFTKYLVVILLSPLLAHLSEKTERILTGNVYPFDFDQFMRDVRRGIRIALRNLFWHYCFFLVIMLVATLGWKEPKSAPVFYLTFAIGFYYYGFSFLDYINERRKLSMNQSILFMRQHRGLAIAIGAVYSLLILVPVDLDIIFSLTSFKNGFWTGMGNWILHLILWFCASSAPILTIVASTIAMNDLVQLRKR